MNRSTRNLLFYGMVALVVAALAWGIMTALSRIDWTVPPKDAQGDDPFAQEVMHRVLRASFSKGYAVKTNLDSLLKRQEKGRSADNLIVAVGYLDGNYGYVEQDYPFLKRLMRLARRGRKIIYTSRITSDPEHNYFGLGNDLSGGDWNFDVNQMRTDHEKTEITVFPTYASRRLVEGAIPTVEIYEAMMGNPFFSANRSGRRNSLSSAVSPKLSGKNGAFLDPRRLVYDFGENEKPQRAVDMPGMRRIRVVLSDQKGHIYGMRYEFAGGGSLTFLAGSAMFTNYGFSSPAWRKLSAPILAPLDDRKVTFVNVGPDDDDRAATDEAFPGFGGESALLFFLKHPPLRLFVWLLFAMGLAAVIFNSRRRFRAVRDRSQPENSSLAFVRQVGTLFGRRTDYTSLAQIEARLLLDALRREFRLELSADSDGSLVDFAPHIAKRTGMDDEQTYRTEQLLTTLDELLVPKDKAPKMKRAAFEQLSRRTNHILRLLQSPSNS